LKHAESTRRNYRIFCDIIKKEVGQFKISDLTFKHKTSVADLCVTVVSALWQFAIEHERLPLGHNPARGIFKLHKKKRITRRWSPEVIEKFEAAATPSLRLALYLLLYTGQREGDVIAMQWDHIRDNMIRIKQQKTDEVVWIDIDPEFKRVLDQTPRINTHILNSGSDKPYANSQTLSKAIKRTLWAIGVEDHSGHGLRVTAACILKEAGCNDDLVAAITGHTEMKTLRLYLKETNRQQMGRVAARAANGRR
jgi:integrase